MRILLVLTLLISTSAIAQSSGQGKAAHSVLPKSAQAFDATKKAKAAEPPCDDKKEDVLKKLEAKKKEQAIVGKGLSLQGATDTGCTLK